MNYQGDFCMAGNKYDYIGNGGYVDLTSPVEGMGIVNYYCPKAPFGRIPPDGWHVATTEDFYMVLDLLKMNDFSEYGLAFLKDGRSKGWGITGLGVDLDYRWFAYIDEKKDYIPGGELSNGYKQTMFWTEDHDQIFISDDNGIYGEKYLDNDYIIPYGSLRFVSNGDRYYDAHKNK